MKVSAEFGANSHYSGNLNGLAMKSLIAIASESAKLEAPEQIENVDNCLQKLWSKSATCCRFEWFGDDDINGGSC